MLIVLEWAFLLLSSFTLNPHQTLSVHSCHYLGFPGESDGKESACNAGDFGSIPELGRSLEEGNGYLPTPVLLPGEFQRSLAGYSPWGCKELDTTERLTLFIPLSSFTSAPHQTLRVQSSHCLGRSHIITKGKCSFACPQEAGRALQLVPALPHRLESHSALLHTACLY